MLQYKANLSVINSRYGDLEQRVLRIFAENPQVSVIYLPGGLDILLMYLLEDNLISDTGETSGVYISGVPSSKAYAITTSGRAFIDKWFSAKEID